MADFRTEIVIIGAGVIGLAIAREVSELGKEVLLVEELNEFGKITSSRNSGVIHAGIYYPRNSLKAKMCVDGNKLLYEYCKKFSIPHKNTKKILVATNENQIKIIDEIKIKAEKNGVQNIEKISKSKVLALEPLINCNEALLVNSSGIIDSYSFMNALEGQVKQANGMIAYNSKVSKINFDGKFFNLQIHDPKNNITTIGCKYLINSAGLYASEVANKIEELNKKIIPKTYYAKGNYFSLSKDLGIRHLVYPIPDGFSLGIHLTLEMDNTIKFGPDVEWVRNLDNYEVNEKRKEIFIKEVLKYLPTLDANLLKANYSGIRPIMNKKDISMRDFIISSDKDHGISGLINLYGIESPGLTSSLSLAKHIVNNFL